MEYDYIVVGAGAAGAAASWNLARKGFSVLCVDRGPILDRAFLPTTSVDWERQKQHEFNPVSSLRNSPYDYPIDDSESPIAICNFNAVGGGTVIYSAHFPRFLRSDFKIYTDHLVGRDWPINYDELTPYFEINERMMAMSGLTGDPYYPEITSALPPIPLGKIGEKLASGFNNLGWHWWPSYGAISTLNRNGRSQCINLGPCNLGCPQGAKSSVDLTYIAEAKKYKFDLISNFAISRVLSQNKRAFGIEGFKNDGSLLQYFGKNVVLASSAVGTPRILLNSFDADFPAGLANNSGLVGKNLMVHPLGYAEGVFSEYLETDIGPQGCLLYSLEFRRGDERDFKLGYMMHGLRGTGVVEAAKTALVRKKLRFGKSLYSDFLDLYGKQAFITIICEDLPDQNNKLELDVKNCDRFGVPGVKVHYQLSQNSKAMLSHGVMQARKVLQAAGAVKTYVSGPVRHTGWHTMGTCVMGESPECSVVDKNGKCHDLEGLFIVDSSVFPTSSCVNPANTIQTLALYLTDKMHERAVR